jgi:hypothetical protein
METDSLWLSAPDYIGHLRMCIRLELHFLSISDACMHHEEHMRNGFGTVSSSLVTCLIAIILPRNPTLEEEA